MNSQFKNAIGKIHCGHKDGSAFLISPTLVITALHVLDDAKNSEVEIEVEFPSLKQEEDIVAKIIYPQSIKCDDLPDIAVLQLSKPVVEITPLHLARINLAEGTKWEAFGYPITKEETGQLFKGTMAQAPINNRLSQYDIDLFCSDPNLADIKYSATGASGSPILVGGYVVGVLTDVMPGATVGMVEISHCQSLLVENKIKTLHLGNLGKYKRDIDKLKEYTRSEVINNSETSKLRVGNQEIKIVRRCVETLQHEAERGSLVVVGEPGSGKSGALSDFVVNLLEEKRDVIFLDVGHISAEGLGALRNELGLTYDLNDVIDNWLGEQAGYLVIDALDAARSEKSVQTLRAVISRVIRTEGRWRIIASVRKFDLRHDNELRRLFYGNKISDYQDDEFHMLRHMKIPAFSDGEILEIAKSIPAIDNLLKQADEALKDLIRIPFNFRIIGELIGEGIENNELIPLHTQSELLDRYWSYRVIRSDGQRDAREILLNNTVGKMVTTRTLKVTRNQVVDASTSKALHDLLSTNVLLEWQPSVSRTPDGSTLSFSHHIIFDFAVDRLLLRGDQQRVVDVLINNPELVLVIRPSFVHHFTNLWLNDYSRVSFWNLVIQLIKKEGIPEVAKLIGPSVAVELGLEITDFSPLLKWFSYKDKDCYEAAEKALNHLVGGFLMMAKESQLTEEKLDLWCQLSEILSRELTSSRVYCVKAILSTLCEYISSFKAEHIRSIGVASRRLLEYGWTNSESEWVILPMMSCICKTFCSNPDESERLLRKFIVPERIKTIGYKELPWLVRELPSLFLHAPLFVMEVYNSTFMYKEHSDEVTSLGHSQILPLRSNRRQDFESALYELAEIYPQYLKQAPFEAIITLILVIENYVINNHGQSQSNYEATFEYNGKKAHFKADYSFIWDSETYSDDEPIIMLDAFQKYLIEIGNDDNQKKLRNNLLELIISRNKLAVIWRRLIIAGKSCPEILGVELKSLAWTYPILVSSETRKEIGDYLSIAWPFLSEEDRKKVEEAILSISSTVTEEKKNIAMNTRDRLLGCLPPELLITKDAKQLVEIVKNRGGFLPNTPAFELGPWESEPFDESQSLQEQGILISEKQNQLLQNLRLPIKTFLEKYQSSKLSSEQAIEIIPLLKTLKDTLDSSEGGAVHSKLQELAWDDLTNACSILAKGELLTTNIQVGNFIKSVLLKSAVHSNPFLEPKQEEAFEKSISWGIPAPRIHAASGIMEIAKYKQYMDSELEDAIRKLSIDSVPAVRFHIVSKLASLHKNHEDFMWNLIIQFARNEANKAIIQELVSSTLFFLAKNYTKEVVELTSDIYFRATGEGRAEKVRKECIRIFLTQFLWNSHIPSKDFIYNIINTPIDCFSEKIDITYKIRNLLTLGSVEQPNTLNNEVRVQSWKLLEKIVENSLKSMVELQTLYSREGKWTEDEENQARNVAEVIDNACKQLYFASGASEEKKQQGVTVNYEFTSIHKRFLQEASVVLDLLSECNIPRVTHYMLQTLEFIAPLNPAGIFKRIGKVVQSGKEGGYQFESLGLNLIVRLVERYLSEFRLIFVEDSDNNQLLLSVLDIFVQAGWPEARRLTYRLDELFR